MCVAIYKPQNVDIPSLETFKKCWNTNPDGAGVMYENEPTAKYCYTIRKGFMQFSDFEKVYNELKNQKEKAMFFHFRIATHGGVTAGNTHPFPISQDIALLQHTHVVSNNVMIHNGVLPITPRLDTISDTAELAIRLSKNGLYKNLKAVKQLFEGFIGTNKIAIANERGIVLLGDWIEINGVFFSNENWNRTAVYSPSWYYGYYDYDDYDGFSNFDIDKYNKLLWQKIKSELLQSELEEYDRMTADEKAVFEAEQMDIYESYYPDICDEIMEKCKYNSKNAWKKGAKF